MHKWLYNLRRKYLPTHAERYEDGCNFARDTIIELGHKVGIDRLWDQPRDADNPFDKGVMDYVNTLMARNSFK